MKDIHECTKRLEAARRRLSSLKYGDLLLKFLDHLQALGLSTSRVLKYATCLCTIFKNAPFDPVRADSMRWKELWHGLTLSPTSPGLSMG